MFKIYDEFHGLPINGKEFETFEEAFAEIKRYAQIPWGEEPNSPPCMSWKTCMLWYHILEFDTSGNRWVELSNTKVLEISAEGPIWKTAVD